MTFEVKLLVNFVATDLIKHVGEETDYEKEETRHDDVTDGVPCRL